MNLDHSTNILYTAIINHVRLSGDDEGNMVAIYASRSSREEHCTNGHKQCISVFGADGNVGYHHEPSKEINSGTRLLSSHGSS
jgi:hypothetical protein